ncbi:MAG TPA: helix-turn-helix domain-containing protein [Dehalococcoidia bacterium]|nr:helix-turn-helix domain-containing protein [Dehalococcoidia bacterium]
MERDDELLTVDQAARLLTISKPTVWRMIRAGELPVVKIAKRSRRIKRSDILAYISRHYTGGQASQEKGVEK